jgi:hypothetical protein
MIDRSILDNLMSKIYKAHHLTENSIGEFKYIKAPLMKFDIESYHAEGLGHVSLMSMNAFFGLMKMDTIIINPIEKDLPLLSYDRVYVMGKDTFIIELYDTRANKGELAELAAVAADADKYPQHDLGEHWYDNIKLPESITVKAGKDFTSAFDKLAERVIDAYVATHTEAEFDGDVKHKKTVDYVEGLLENGGPPTRIFQKLFGKEKTAKLFREVLFGTEK